MDNKQLIDKINSLGKWYHNVKFNDEVSAVSSHSKLSGEYAWSYIKQLLPESLKGKRVLDLGCNAGLFCVRCAQMGADEVVGIDADPVHLRQNEFLREYFDTPNVRIINDNLENIPNMNLGKFDIVLAIAVLYWVGRFGKPIAKGTHYDEKYRNIEKRFIDYITTMSDTFIIRVRGQKPCNTREYYAEVFGEHGFEITKGLYEDIGTHEMLLFERRDG
jgi:2-polyprenyl-3-methyl-5-hydroxy-6-metoxy-1,4-benzoquinol methylase